MIKGRDFLKGNEALAYGALAAGLNAFFAYPITPSSEIPETLARELGSARYPQFGVFLQAASEIEAINMVMGAAATGARVLTATSGPGFSLMQEGISYLAGMELPAVIVNVNRAGPGLGNLGPEQSDYFQATRGGGHGGYRTIVLAPASVREMARQPYLAFSLAFKYRNPVVILVDAFLGQLKEDIVLPEPEAAEAAHSWAVGQRRDAPQLISSIHLEQADQSAHARHLLTKFRTIEEREPRWEGHLLEDARVVLVGFGVAARLAKSVVHRMRHKGSHVGLLRPITLQPFPYDAVRRLARAGAHFVVVELSGGQMVEDVRAAVAGAARVESVGEVGGLLPRQDAIMQAAEWVYSA